MADLSPKRASRIASKLDDAFEDVVVDGSSEAIQVRARRHTRGPSPQRFCDHGKSRIARNVRAAIVDDNGRKFLAGPGRKRVIRRLAVAETCLSCDLLINFREESYN